jgi:putative heme-binding domain-containing protein
LAAGDPAAWVKMLEHPNGWVRQTANRLLAESGDASQVAALVELSQPGHTAFARINALHVLDGLQQLPGDVLVQAINDQDPIVRKNALRIIAEKDHSGVAPDLETVQARINDTDPRARLNALIALGTFDLSPDIAQAVVTVWPDLRDKYLQSAALGVAAKDPLLFIRAVLKDRDPAFRADLLTHLTRVLAQRQGPEAVGRLVVLLAGQPSEADGLKQVALEALAATAKLGLRPPWTPALRSALANLIKSSHGGLAGASLPLVARWDQEGSLAAELKPVSQRLGAKLLDSSLPDEQRGQIAANLLGLHKLDPQIIPAVGGLLGSAASEVLQQRVVEALGSTGDPAAASALVAVYGNLSEALRESAFGQLMQRADWTLDLIQAVADQRVPTSWLGPARLYRLRTHPDSAVAAKAAAVIDALRGPVQTEKEALLAQLRLVVTQPSGDTANGHKLFTANCASCHVFKNEGRDLAPNLTGMGAHGPADLLVHILDPNRQVEPNYRTVNLETKDDLSFDGIIARENQAEVVLRNATADYTIRKDTILRRRSTALSLMPEGFEALGAEALRDLLAYLCAEENRFRILDLSAAFTVNTGRGIYSAPEAVTDAPAFRKHGLVTVEGVPFDLVSPRKAASNAIVLKGGSGYAKGLPQRVEVQVGVAAQRLHFLGGIGGWGWPGGGDEAKNKPVVKVTLHFAGGTLEEMVFRNGLEFADWIDRIDVPGSKGLPELASRGQVRWFSKDVRGSGVIERLALESYDNEVAPTLLGITAELATPAAEHQARAARPKGHGGNGGQGATPIAKVLIAGGGSAHDFERWFNHTDVALLKGAGKAEVVYTSKPEDLPSVLPKLDVLVQTSNQPFPGAALRQALFDFAASGKGFVLVHAGLWYNWPDWPAYNQQLCGGGSRGHNALGEFEVTITEPDHPLTRGVPAKFTIRDELYWFEPDPQGARVHVLATAFSVPKNKTYPIIFTVAHPKARIAAITLGHDGDAHQHPAYQRLLRNAVDWAAGKTPGETSAR